MPLLSRQRSHDRPLSTHPQPARATPKTPSAAAYRAGKGGGVINGDQGVEAGEAGRASHTPKATVGSINAAIKVAINPPR